ADILVPFLRTSSGRLGDSRPRSPYRRRSVFSAASDPLPTRLAKYGKGVVFFWTPLISGQFQQHRNELNVVQQQVLVLLQQDQIVIVAPGANDLRRELAPLPDALGHHRLQGRMVSMLTGAGHTMHAPVTLSRPSGHSITARFSLARIQGNPPAPPGPAAL